MNFMNDRIPDIQGTVAKAWEIRWKSDEPDKQGAIGGYAVQGPFHLMWNMWMISAVHLRDIKGGTPVKKSKPESTHEITIISIDSKKQDNFDPHADVRHPDLSVKILTPYDLVHQFEADNDAQVRNILDTSVKAICDGKISPDSDYRSSWATLIDNSIIHDREGRDCCKGNSLQ